MSRIAHGIRFDTPIDAALYALAMSKQYQRSGDFWDQFARTNGFPISDDIAEYRRHSRRLEDKGERVLLLLRDLYHYNLFGIEPHVEAIAQAFDAANTFVTQRAIQLQPSHLNPLQKGLRLIATSPDLNGGKR